MALHPKRLHKPSAQMVEPEINDALSPIKKAARLATSTGCPAHPQRGCIKLPKFSQVLASMGKIDVATRPGMTAFT